MYDYRDDIAAVYDDTYQQLLARDAALFQSDRGAFEQAGIDAWAWRYLPAVAANYQVRVQAGVAEPKDAFRLAETLMGMDKVDAALAVLPEPTTDFAKTTVYWFRRAEMLLASDRLEEAVESLRRAQAASPSKEAVRLTERIERVRTLEASVVANATWEVAGELADEALALNLKGVLDRLIEVLTRADPPASLAQEASIAAVGRAAVRMALPKAQPFLDRVNALNCKGDATAALRVERDLRLGAFEAAKAYADKRRSAASGRDLLYLSALAAEACGDRNGAIRQLGPLSSRFDRDHDIRSALARFVGEDALERIKPQFAPRRSQTGERRRVINLIPFNNEMTMLETRLREMGDWVDLFVIVEAAQSFMGAPKRCGFDENKHLFAEHGDKIRHVKLDAFPDHIDSAWARDCWQRDMALAAIDGYWAPDDLVLLTDSDEIVRREAVAAFDIGLIALKMKTYRYFFNYEALPGNPKNDGHTGVICNAEHLARFGASYIRFVLSRPNKMWNFIPRAGWHFTSMGDAETLVRKFSSYAHQEKNKVKLKSNGHMEALLERIRNGQFEDGWARCEIDASYPAVIRESQEPLRELIL